MNSNYSPTISLIRFISSAMRRRRRRRSESWFISGRIRWTASAIESSRWTPARLMPAFVDQVLDQAQALEFVARIDAHAADRPRRADEPEPLVLAQRLRVHVEQARSRADKVKIRFAWRSCVDPNVGLDTGRVKVCAGSHGHPAQRFSHRRPARRARRAAQRGQCARRGGHDPGPAAGRAEEWRCDTAWSARSLFRIVATLLAVYLIRLAWVKLLGGLYLLYLTYQHFFRSGDAEERSKPRPARPWLGLSALWGTILKVELVNIAFSVDSILVAVAMSPKTWVVLTGGLLGIVAMRVVISQLLAIVRRYPALVDGAFIIIALVGAKLLLEYAVAMEWIHFEVPKWVSLAVIVVTFVAAYLYARRKGPVDDDDDEAAAALHRCRARHGTASGRRSSGRASSSPPRPARTPGRLRLQPLEHVGIAPFSLRDVVDGRGVIRRPAGGSSP